MPRTLQPIILGGTIDDFSGLHEGEEYRIIPFGLVRRGVITQQYADWLFENEPLKDSVVLVVAVDGKQIIKHRAATRTGSPTEPKIIPQPEAAFPYCPRAQRPEGAANGSTTP
jgi:hypothetical protein